MPDKEMSKLLILVSYKCVNNSKFIVPAAPGQQNHLVTISMLQQKSCAMIRAYVYLSSAHMWWAPVLPVPCTCGTCCPSHYDISQHITRVDNLLVRYREVLVCRDMSCIGTVPY